MKKSVTTILDGCQPQELDSVLETMDDKLPDEVNAQKIRSLAMQKAGVTKRVDWRRVFLVAACIALVAAVLVGCYVAEKAEYDSAVKFFDLNDFDTEGLSRDDIKRVYRDFTTERFDYDKSYELLDNSREVTTVAGADIRIMNSVNNDLNLTNGYLWNRASDKGVSYVYNSDVGTAYGKDDEGYTYYRDTCIEKFLDGKVVWRADFERDFYIEGYDVRDGKVLVWGDDMYDTKRDLIHTAVALVDDADGTILWEQTLDSSYDFDEYSEAALGDNGRIAVLTIACNNRFADWDVRVFRALNEDGKIVTEHEQKMEKILYNHLLTSLSDGWLAEIQYEVNGSDTDNGVVEYQPRLVKFNFDGEIMREWTLTENDNIGEIVSVKEYGGKIWISEQARPNNSELYAGDDITDLPDPDKPFENYTDEWRDRARKEFSSVLIVLDPESAKPEQFFSVGGTMPVGVLGDGNNNDFSVDDDGNLVWHIGRIIRCGDSPYTSSFSIYGITRQYDYTFDSDIHNLRQEKTDQFDSFRTH